MKKLLKNNILGFILGVIITGSIGVVAYTLSAKDISFTPSDSSWNVTNVGDAIDDLKSKETVKKVCELKDGNHLEVGSKYECDPGDGTKRNFYVLTVKSDGVDLIMDRNISEGTMTWNNAMVYFKSGAGSSISTSWKDVQNIDLPKAQAIADAVGNSSWIAANSGATWWCLASHKQDSQSAPNCNTSQASAYNWLYDYTRACNGCSNSLSDTNGQPYGYWTRDLVSGASNAWFVDRNGYLSSNAVSLSAYEGVRPVITLSKSNLAS